MERWRGGCYWRGGATMTRWGGEEELELCCDLWIKSAWPLDNMSQNLICGSMGLVFGLSGNFIVLSSVNMYTAKVWNGIYLFSLVASFFLLHTMIFVCLAFSTWHFFY
jgi:hypothetical protein